MAKGMNKLTGKILFPFVCISLSGVLSGCIVAKTSNPESVYVPGSNHSEIYSVGFFPYPPYLGNPNFNYGWRDGYWSGYRGITGNSWY